MTTRARITEVTAGAVQEVAIPEAVILAEATPAGAVAVVLAERAMKTGRKCIS